MSTLGTMVFVLVLATTNFGLGFALAMFLGHGPRRWLRWQFSGVGVELSLQSGIAEDDSGTESVDDQLVSQPRANDSVDEHLPEQFEPQPTLDGALPLDVALAQLRDEVSVVRDELDEIDERVRECSQSPTCEAVEERVAELKEAGQRLLEQQSGAMSVLDDCLEESTHDEAIGQGVREAADEQAEQIRESLERFDGWEVDPENLAEDCQRLLAETQQMMHSCDSMNESIDLAASQLSVHQDESSAEVEAVEPANEEEKSNDQPDELGESDDDSHTPIEGTAVLRRR